MKIAVWDTYVKLPEGVTWHFDILVPEHVNDEDIIYEYGKKYLDEKGIFEFDINSENCRFCHIENAEETVINQIKSTGYYILFLEEIPKNLPDYPKRRDLILHIRAHYPAYRFENFKDKTEEDMKQLINVLDKDEKN